MNKVFIVTEGIYSAFHIEDVFSTREKAEEYIRSQTDPEQVDEKDRFGSYNIDERIVDSSYKSRVFRTVHVVYLATDTGSVNRTYSNRTESPYAKGYRGSYRISYPYSLVYSESIISHEHAMKLAVEGRQNYLRSQNMCVEGNHFLYIDSEDDVKKIME